MHFPDIFKTTNVFHKKAAYPHKAAFPCSSFYFTKLFSLPGFLNFSYKQIFLFVDIGMCSCYFVSFQRGNAFCNLFWKVLINDDWNYYHFRFFYDPWYGGTGQVKIKVCRV